jgi:predicted dehydrogenase
MENKPYRVLLIGAGNRGAEVYGEWILNHPELLKITAVAEPIDSRRGRLAEKHRIPGHHCYQDWQQALKGPKIADAAIITTQDALHTQPALKALETGYDVLLEKPMAPTLAECVTLVQAAETQGRLLQIAHVLRYTDFFQEIHHQVHSGELGQVITVSHRENVSAWHMAHSFVRGNWRRSDQSSPMILAKSCHDLDILYWILNTKVTSISSIGSLLHFRSENAPEGAPERCTDGCPAAETCPFYAPMLYQDLEPILLGLSSALQPGIRLTGRLMRSVPGLMRVASSFLPVLRQLTDFSGWPRSIITEHPTDSAAIQEAMETGPYGRCVYRSDNDVVDHQIVLMEMEDGVSVSFTMHGHSFEEGRTIRIDGSNATLLGKFGWNKTFIEVHQHRGGGVKRIDFPNNIEGGGHGGGDDGLMQAFVHGLDRTGGESLSDARSALESHLLAFAAEQARKTNSVIDFSAFRREAANTID